METLTSRTIKGYELREQVGAGGFGAVYHAYQSSVGREVAIKVILPQHANHPDFVRRFEAEAQLVARLEHPHIVPLYDYWRDPDGAYLVMRWLPNNLHQVIQRGPCSAETATRLLEQLAAALTVAHREGIVHRDIKPDNILLDEDDNAYLADFGIAKNLNVGSITEEGALVGSPAYITPEQIKGEPITPRADIYSLGLVMYEMLANEKPFPDATTPLELIHKHLNTPLPSLTVRRPNLPAALNEVLQTATAKEPDQRYTNILRFAAAFRAAAPSLQRLPSQPLPDPLTQRELDILRLMTDGSSNQEIAQALYLALETVRWYVKQIYSKLDVHGRQQAIERAQQLNLLAGAAPRGEVVEASVELIRFEPTFAGRAESTSQLMNPYKGLRAFQEVDAADFFGRAALTEQLLARLTGSGEGGRFLVVVGPSGSGKSSVIKAGLIPALRKGGLTHSERWFVTDMQPGTHPFEELEAALLRIAVNPLPGLLAELSEDRRGLVRVAKRLLPSDQDVELVLVIDQFEELFTLLDDEKVRAHFIDNLLSAASDPRSRVRLILTLRADFYDRPLRYPRLAELMRSHTEVIVPLTQAELERAIAGPAERIGLSLQPGLVNSMLADVGDQPGTLPLLQYALTELFERRSGPTFSLDAYRASGGISGTLARRADELYEDFEPAAQVALRQLFLRLIALGEGTEDTRRRVLQTELALLTINERIMDDVLAEFGQYRLLTFDHDPLTRGPTVEIAHEALIHEWQRLRGWLVDNREDLHVQRRLMASVADWMRSGKDASFLAAGARLAQFEALRADGKLALNETEVAYLDASITERDAHHKETEARRERELTLARQAADSAQQAAQSAQKAATAQRRAAHRLRYLVVMLAIFLLVASGLSWLASTSRAEAFNNLTLSESQRLAAEASTVLATNGSAELATLLAVRSLATTYSPQGDAMLQRALREPHARRLFVGHTDRVWAVAFSPDGKYVLSGSLDKTASLWDAQTGRRLQQFLGHTARINAVAFSPDGKSVVTGSNDKTARLWDVQNGRELRQFVGHTDGVYDVTFSPDGKYIVTTGSYDKTVRLWDVQTGREIRRFLGHTSFVRTVVFSPDGRSVFSSSQDQTVRMWDVETGEEQREFKGAVFNAIAVSPDGRYLVTAAGTSVQIWDITTGQPIRTFLGHTDFVWWATYSPDGRYILTGSVDSTARLWDVESGQTVSVYAGHTGGIAAVAFSPDGRSILTGGDDQTIRLWDVQTTPLPGSFITSGSALYAVAVTADGRYALIGGSDPVVRVWDTQTGQQVRQFAGHANTVTSIAVSPDSKYAVTGSLDSTARLWDIQTGQELRQFTGHKTDVSSVAYSFDGRYVLTAGADGTARLWDAQTGQQLRQFTGHVGTVQQATFSHDGRFVLTGGDDLTIRVWNADTGQELREFIGHTAPVLQVAFSTDDRYVASASSDKTARLWDVQTGKAIRVFQGHSARIRALAYAPDGKFLLTGGFDYTARLWDIQTGQEIRRFASHRGTVAAVAFFPNGQSVLTVGFDSTAQLSPIDYRGLIDVACGRLLRDFTDDERLQFTITDPAPTCPHMNKGADEPATWTPIPIPPASASSPKEILMMIPDTVP